MINRVASLDFHFNLWMINEVASQEFHFSWLMIKVMQLEVLIFYKMYQKLLWRGVIDDNLEPHLKTINDLYTSPNFLFVLNVVGPFTTVISLRNK